LDRLSNFLKQDDTILITCGYSWGDEHINSRILSALKTETTSHVIGLIYDKAKDKDGNTIFNLSEDSKLAALGLNNSKVSLYGGRTAIIGCNLGEWVLKSKPTIDDTVNLYFDEDAYANPSEELNNEAKDNDVWTGKGEFILPDFSKLVSFLNSMISDNEIQKMGENAKK
jgi:hypothetical protein